MAPDTSTAGLRATRPHRSPRSVGPPRPPAPETIPEQTIGAARFARSLLHLSRPEIELHVAGLKARRNSPDDDIAWWEATTALNRALRCHGARHQAAMAAQLASQAILAAASRSGLALSPDVAAVARSAGDVARVLVAGDPRTSGADYLTRDWEDLLLPPPDPPAPSHRLLSAGRAGGHREEQPTSGTRPASLESRG